MMKNISTILLLLVLFNPVFAHHGAESSSNLQAIDPVTGRQKPGDYIMVSEELRKGAIGYRDEYISTFYGEKKFLDGKLSATLLTSYYYYDQKEREHAGRIGKTYLGLRAAPLQGKFEHFNLIFDGSIGFPSGKDTDKFTGGNYYNGIAGMSAIVNWSKYIISGRVYGIFPVGKSTYTDPLTNNEILLKKVTAGLLTAGYRITENNILSAGYLAMSPYYGIEKKTVTEGQIPGEKAEPDHSIYREYLAGLSHRFSDKISLTGYYKRPVYRNEYKPYEESYSLSLIFQFN